MNQILALATDLSNNNPEIVAKMRSAVTNPPMTLKEVGFYGAERNPPDMNCFLFMITALREAGYILSAEDKYVIELLEEFGQRIYLPQQIRSWFPKRLGWDGNYEAIGLNKKEHGRAETRFLATFAEGVKAMEAAFEAKQTPLRILQFYVGDTIPFITVSPELAKRWDDVPVAMDRDGVTPLCLCKPDWHRFLHHVAYAAGFDVHF